MKKYKLIKAYPGSPPLETIGERYQNLSIKFINIKGEIWHSSEHPELIENHPEYWEEIVEKEYEILSFKQINGVEDLWLETKKGSNQWSRGGKYTWPYTTSEILAHELYQIHSVKRLSDGEIFTIGDKIKGFKEDTNPFTITYIFTTSYHEKEELVFTNYPKNTSPKNGRSAYLSTIIKAKQLLFTTVDGVDIYEDQEFYWLDTGLNIRNSGYTKLRGNPFNTLYFSTKEAAEEHILLNKSCLSINDILNLRDGLMFIEKELRELVKSKLK